MAWLGYQLFEEGGYEWGHRQRGRQNQQGLESVWKCLMTLEMPALNFNTPRKEPGVYAWDMKGAVQSRFRGKAGRLLQLPNYFLVESKEKL